VGITEFDQNRAFGVLGKAARESHRPELIRQSSAGSCHGLRLGFDGDRKATPGGQRPEARR
jgi:hypothetical protein